MTARLYSVEEKLEAIGGVIDSVAWVKRSTGTYTAEHETYLIFKQIDADYRAKLTATQNRTLQALEHQVNSAVKAKARIGFVEVGYLQAIAECVMAHWPVIRTAMENLKGERG